jgi:hypothetical protein
MPGLVFALVFTLFHDLISCRFPYFSTLGALMDARYLRIVAGVWGCVACLNGTARRARM